MAQDKMISITGRVMDKDRPLKGANIQVVGSQNGTVSDTTGKYQIQVPERSVLRFTHIGYSSREIIMEDMDRTLNVEMVPKLNELKEVTVTKTIPRKSQKQLFLEYNENPNLIKTGVGILDKETVDYSMRILDESNIKIVYPDLSYLLNNRFAGVRSTCNNFTGNLVTYLRTVMTLGKAGGGGAIYEVDGIVFEKLPCQLVNPSEIKRIAIVPSFSGLTRYGSIAKGGVVIINTKTGNFSPGANGIPNYDQALVRNNQYENDALQVDALQKDVPEYIRRLQLANEIEDAKRIYLEESKRYSNSMYFVLDAYEHFANSLNNQEFAAEIIRQKWDLFEDNPIALKALAYIYQAQGRYKEANTVYKEIFILRPNYAQSYTDLANSYREIGEHQKAAGIYVRYGYLLDQGFLRAEVDLGTIMDRELNNLVALKGKELLDKRDLKKLVLDDEFKGTRLVFEWSDSEAEFELQFVNTEGKYFKSEHSLLADADRIKDEKLSGFSSEEYLIDDSIRGVWQVNAKYLGNKSLTPTYLKTTIYHNYGSASQRKETKVFKLSLRNVNQQLFTVSNMARIVSK